MSETVLNGAFVLLLGAMASAALMGVHPRCFFFHLQLALSIVVQVVLLGVSVTLILLSIGMQKVGEFGIGLNRWITRCQLLAMRAHKDRHKEGSD